MPQQIEIPGQGIVEFPDEMDDAAITAAAKRLSTPEQAAGTPPSPVVPPGALPRTPEEYGQQVSAEPTRAEEQAAIAALPTAEAINISGEPRTNQPGDIYRGAALETVPLDVTKTLAQTPVIEGVRNIYRAGQALSDVLFGGKSMAEAGAQRFPESQELVGVEQRPIRERTAIGANTLVNLLFGAEIGRGAIEPARLTERLPTREVTPEQQALAEQTNRVLAEAQQPPVQEVIPSATQERQITEGRVAEYPGDGTRRPPAETGGRGGVEPGAEVGGEVRAPEAAVAPAAEAPPAPAAAAERPPTEPPAAISTAAARPEESPHITSIRNAYVDQERAARGLQPAMAVAQRDFGEVWGQAMRRIDENPTYATELVAELNKKERAINDIEDAAITHRQIDLQNQYQKASNDLIKARETGDETALTENRIRLAKLGDDLLEVYNAGKAAGTETGRGLNARKILAAEDFSLANMVTQKRAANMGKPIEEIKGGEGEVRAAHNRITAAQVALDAYETSPRAEAYRRQLVAREAEYRRRTAAGKFVTPPRKTLQLDPDHLRLQANVERAKVDFLRALNKDRLSQRGPIEKSLDAFARWRRAGILSSPVIFAKLGSAAAQRMLFDPIEEAIGGAIGKGFPKFEAKAQLEGKFNANAEAKALTEGVTKGMKDAWDKIRTGQTDIEVTYGKRNVMPRYASDFFGNLHGALKTVPQRAAFARSFEKQVARGIANGVDVTEPAVQMSYGVRALKEANKRLFLQDNRIVSAYQRGLTALQQPEKATGRVSLAGKAAATAAKVALPVVKVPTNIVAETMQYATGTLTGSARLARAYARGIKNLSPEEADLISRSLKKGVIGDAALLLGYFNPGMFGGYYQKGEKRGPEELKPGYTRIGGKDLPPYLTHQPLMIVSQVGATIRRVQDSHLRKSDKDPQGLPAGLMAGALGLAEDVPFFRQMFGEIPKLFEPHQRQQYVNEQAKSIIIPQAIDFAARSTDKRAGEVVKRKPKTFGQTLMTGIPGLRERVPEKPAPTVSETGRGTGRRVPRR